MDVVADHGGDVGELEHVAHADAVRRVDTHHRLGFGSELVAQRRVRVGVAHRGRIEGLDGHRLTVVRVDTAIDDPESAATEDSGDGVAADHRLHGASLVDALLRSR